MRGSPAAAMILQPSVATLCLRGHLSKAAVIPQVMAAGPAVGKLRAGSEPQRRMAVRLGSPLLLPAPPCRQEPGQSWWGREFQTQQMEPYDTVDLGHVSASEGSVFKQSFETACLMLRWQRLKVVWREVGCAGCIEGGQNAFRTPRVAREPFLDGLSLHLGRGPWPAAGGVCIPSLLVLCSRQVFRRSHVPELPRWPPLAAPSARRLAHTPYRKGSPLGREAAFPRPAHGWKVCRPLH